jgi:NTP pyrophosphatase (non-canonical NTP hydrolase)
MQFNYYQDRARETAVYPKEHGLDYVIHGLTSEAGEVAGKRKKVLRDNAGVMTDEKRKELVFECGDILWYCAMLAEELGYDLDTVATLNVNKLAERKLKGKISGSGDNR